MLPQFLLILFCLCLPVYLLYFAKDHSKAIAWIAIITMLDIFNSQLYMNLAAIPLFGFCAIPYVWQNRKNLLANTAVKWLGIYFSLLVLLGIYYGFINPWPDLSGTRSIKDQSAIRSILHLGRTLGEGISILYLVLQIEKNSKATASQFLKFTFFSAIALCMGGAIEAIFNFDLYHFFTGGRDLVLPGRMHGLAYEPRGMSQNLSYAILLTPFVPLGIWRYFLIPVFALFAYGLTISFTGIAVLTAGILTLLVLAAFTYRSLLVEKWKSISLSLAALLVFFATLFQVLPDRSTYYLKERLLFFTASDIAAKFEVFDAAAINFLNHNPQNYLLGAGPGMIYLPASAYVLERDNYIYNNKLSALPHVGAVLVLSNAGILGLCIFIFALFQGFKNHANKKDLVFTLGVLLTTLFLIQIRYFFIFGIAALISRVKDKKV